MRYERTVPSHVEPIFLRSLAGNPNDWSFGPTEDPEWNIAGTSPDRQDDLDAAIEGYDPALLAREKQSMLEDVASIRWERTQHFTYDGVLTQADPAIAVITGKLTLRRELGVPDEVTDRWKLANGEFRLFDKPAIVQFGAAIGMHIQDCFNREDELTTEIMAAPDLVALEAIDIETGWPE